MKQVKKTWIILGIILFCLTPLLNHPALAQKPKLPDHLVKLGMMVNIVKLTRWPHELQEPFTFCFVKAQKLSSAMHGLQDLQIHGMSVKTINKKADNGLGECQVLYLGGNYSGSIPKITLPLNQKPILTFSDHLDFLDGGGAFAFYRLGAKMRFAVSRNHLRPTGLKVSSEVLKLATIHREKE